MNSRTWKFVKIEGELRLVLVTRLPVLYDEDEEDTDVGGPPPSSTH